MLPAFQDLVPANCALLILTQEADAVMQLRETASGAGAMGMERRIQGRPKRQSGQDVRPDVRGVGALKTLISGEREGQLQTSVSRSGSSGPLVEHAALQRPYGA